MGKGFVGSVLFAITNSKKMFLGFKKLNGPVIRDLFKDIREEVVPSAVKERIEKVAMENGIRFAPWTEGGYEECMVKQQENFVRFSLFSLPHTLLHSHTTFLLLSSLYKCY